MSRLIKTHKTGFIAAVLAVAVILVAIVAVMSLRQRPLPAQEVALSARDVSFWLPDRPGQPNPPLHLTRGRPVRLTLRNDEPDKVLHCFTIGAMAVKSSRDLATGESELLTFTPSEAGTFAYACLMHPSMAGQIVVE
jgi:heme/copper-type cytochrome/quinol oxidase subunit 2